MLWKEEILDLGSEHAHVNHGQGKKKISLNVRLERLRVPHIPSLISGLL